MTDSTTRPAVAYGDGKGYLNIYCVDCRRPAGVTLPLNIEDVDPYESCRACGRNVVDVARAREAHQLYEGPAPLCGRTEGVDGKTYAPCTRPAGHREAYCRSANGHELFLAAPAKGSVY